MVREFHEAFGVAIDQRDRVTTPQRRRLLQQFLMRRHRNSPIDRDQSPVLVRIMWDRIKTAYAHQFAKANAWDDDQPQPAKQLAIDDVSAPYPPIVHAAGVIPPEVEQAVTAQIEQRHLAQAVVGHGWEHGDVVVICPVDPTPEPGWLKRWLRRWFG